MMQYIQKRHGQSNNKSCHNRQTDRRDSGGSIPCRQCFQHVSSWLLYHQKTRHLQRLTTTSLNLCSMNGYVQLWQPFLALPCLQLSSMLRVSRYEQWYNSPPIMPVYCSLNAFRIFTASTMLLFCFCLTSLFSAIFTQ